MSFFREFSTDALPIEGTSSIKEDIESYKIGGAICRDYDIMAPYRIGKGGGSAFGGEYKPAKPEDERFVGVPGEIKVSYAKDGSKIETHIGPDGLADMERHHTGRPNPHTHSNPHDHAISFVSPNPNQPNFGPAINYWEGAPEFTIKAGGNMSSFVRTNSFEENRFKTISDFKWSLICGGEVTFEWNGILYGAYRDGEYGHSEEYCICLINGDDEHRSDSLDGLLDVMIGSDRLRDIITQVTVWSRNT